MRARLWHGRRKADEKAVGCETIRDQKKLIADGYSEPITDSCRD